MSAGHDFTSRPDGYCSNHKCYKHESDPVGFDFCPAGGRLIRNWKLLPDDKYEAWLDAVIMALGELAVMGFELIRPRKVTHPEAKKRRATARARNQKGRKPKGKSRR